MVRTDRHIILWMAALCMAVAGILHSCTDDLGIEAPRPTEVVCFTAALGGDSIQTSTRSTAAHLSIVEEEWHLEGMSADTASSATRATLTTSLEGTAGVIAYNGDEILTDLNNKEFSFNGDELNAATPIYWKNIETGLTSMDVYAYAPYDKLNGTITGKTFTYTLPTTADEQLDIIVAKSTVGSTAFRKTIPLTFTHALTAVQFKLGSDITASEVESVSISGVHNTGSYTIGEGWTVDATKTVVSYTTTPGELLMLMPQTLPEGAKVTLTFNDNTIISAPLKGQKWEEGKLITYTLHKSTQPTYIYLDLAAGNVTINATTYSGAYYQTTGEGENKKTEKVTISNKAHSNQKFYIYQSTSTNQSTTGLVNDKWVLPVYPAVMSPNNDGKTWSEYITNNTNVDHIIDIWHKESDSETAGKVGRTYTENNINVSGELMCNITIDNLYSVKQTYGNSTADGGIIFKPSGEESTLTLNTIGDCRFGNIYYGSYSKSAGHQLIFEGTGTLTLADVDGNTSDGSSSSHGGAGYISNWWKAVIGADDGSSTQNCYGIVFKSGVYFVGSTKAENCAAIGGGGNGHSTITINGGTITAVATTTAATIGGGIGFNSAGGEGTVTITGGNVYAYNFANRWDIPSAAIGGGGSKDSKGSLGTVHISGGNVYAQSALGTAIGGGSSYSTSGGSADVTITGGNVVAKSVAAESSLSPGTIIPAGAGIGGGTGSSSIYNASGGNATVTISGNPIIRTGSVGGGKKGKQSTGTIGSATINISDNPDIQAQFVLAKGTASDNTNSFTMTGDATIRNSDTADEEYAHIQLQGGAVYLENGTCTIKGGTIENCLATEGGAIYISGTNNTTFTMTSGTISNCTSKAGNGGAVYLKGGTVTLTGGTISDNLAQGGNGGGIYIKDGSFYMPASSTASITENSAILRNSQGGNGGGLYVTSASNNVMVDILSGNITNNSSNRWGGGVCVDMSSTNKAANVKVGTDGQDGPTIESNHTLLSGGGLYVSGVNADITINGGKIKGNTTSAYVPNVDVANEGGMVTLNEGVSDENVPCVTVTFHSNDGNNLTKTQKIVTSTNSLLGDPQFNRTGYTLKGWNTRADGKGTGYAISNQVMNISEDIDLYAQWEI